MVLRCILGVVTLMLVACDTDSDISDPGAHLDGVLLQEGTGAGVGGRCDADFQCARPLRCMAAACAVPPAVTGVPTAETAEVVLARRDGSDWVVAVEVVDDSFERRQGLMWRTQLAPGWGMLFIFDDEAERAFWMHNTYVSLDMVFIRADGSISNLVEQTEPLNMNPDYTSTEPVQYVLEVAGGSATREGLRLDMPVQLVAVPE